MNALLPDGWTVEQVRSASDDATADLLSLERLVVIEQHGFADYDVLQPDVIIAFHSYDMCLARVGEDWFMGQLEPDGSVICWASYGPDLGWAIRGL